MTIHTLVLRGIDPEITLLRVGLESDVTYPGITYHIDAKHFKDFVVRYSLTDHEIS